MEWSPNLPTASALGVGRALDQFHNNILRSQEADNTPTSPPTVQEPANSDSLVTQWQGGPDQVGKSNDRLELSHPIRTLSVLNHEFSIALQALSGRVNEKQGHEGLEVFSIR